MHCKCIGKCTFSAPCPKYYKPFEKNFLGPKLKIFCFIIQNIGLVYWPISRFKRFRLSVIFVKEFLSVLLQPLYILLFVNEHDSVCLFICLSLSLSISVKFFVLGTRDKNTVSKFYFVEVCNSFYYSYKVKLRDSRKTEVKSLKVHEKFDNTCIKILFLLLNSKRVGSNGLLDLASAHGELVAGLLDKDGEVRVDLLQQHQVYITHRNHPKNA